MTYNIVSEHAAVLALFMDLQFQDICLSPHLCTIIIMSQHRRLLTNTPNANAHQTTY